jgi:hypothetical protein
MAPHRRLIVALVLAGSALLGGCKSESVAPFPEAEPAMPTGRGTREDPPDIGSPSSGGSGGSAASGFAPLEGCPATRMDEPPVAQLTEAEIRAAVGIYRACTESRGLEIRMDDATGELSYYRLDERFVRVPQANGTIDVVSCEGSVCTLNWNEAGAARAYQVELWRAPTALTFFNETFAQEWVRAAD